MAPPTGELEHRYRTDLIDDEFKKNESWSIFYDDKYAGKVSMLKRTRDLDRREVGGKSMRTYQLSGDARRRSEDIWREGGEEQPILWTDASSFAGVASGGIAAYAGTTSSRNHPRGCRGRLCEAEGRVLHWFCGLTLLNSARRIRPRPTISSTPGLSPRPANTSSRHRVRPCHLKSFEIANPRMSPPWASPIRLPT